MNLNSIDDCKKVVETGLELVEQKMQRLFDEKKVKEYNRQITTKERATWKKTLDKFITDIMKIDLFSFFPYEAIKPETFAVFCVEHLFARGAFSYPGITIKSKEDHSRQLMDNLKKEKYYVLRRDNAVNTFIIGKESLPNIFKDEDNIPDVLYPELNDISDKFRENILNPERVDNGIRIDVNKMTFDLIDDFKQLFELLAPIAANRQMAFAGRRVTVVSHNPETIISKMQSLRCMCDAVNYIIQETMQLFIMDYLQNNSSNEIIRMQNFAESLSQKAKVWIDHYRQDWLKDNSYSSQASLMKELSIKFAFYINEIAKNSYRYDIVNKLNNGLCKPYDEEWDKFANDPQNIALFLTEGEKDKVSSQKVEKAREVAKEFYYEHGFNSGKDDFMYIVKAFYYEIYHCKFMYDQMTASELLKKEAKGNELTLDEHAFRRAVYDRAFFRQKQQIENYMNFYNVYIKLCKITEQSYLTLDPETGLLFLKGILENYILFYLMYK